MKLITLKCQICGNNDLTSDSYALEIGVCDECMLLPQEEEDCFDCPGCPCPDCILRGWDADS